MKPDDIIVVDDGSDDDPAAVVAEFVGVRMIRQENRGLSDARNTGLRKCTTTHVVFLDADDVLLPIALEVGLACAVETARLCLRLWRVSPRFRGRSSGICARARPVAWCWTHLSQVVAGP